MKRISPLAFLIAWLGLAAAAVSPIYAADSPTAGSTPPQPGNLSGEGTGTVRVTHPNLFLNRAEIDAMREKIRQRAWAGRLYQRLQAQVEDTLRGGQEYAHYYDPSPYPGVDIGGGWTTARRTRDVALAAVISGEARYVEKVRDILLYYVAAFAGTPPSRDVVLRGAPGDVNLWGQSRIYDQLSPAEQKSLFPFLTFGAPRTVIGLCWAYDLVHDRLSPVDREAVENFLRRLARTAMVPLAKFPVAENKLFWGRALCGVVGYTVGDRELIHFALDAPGGLKDTLEKGYRDQLWYGANAYDLVYVSSMMVALAEAALRGDGIDLYRWRSASGNSIRDFFDTSLKLAFLRYRDSSYAWVLAQNPARDQWDHALWGYLALTHGGDLPERVAPPAAPSSIFPANGMAMLRADESSSYWTSPGPAVSIRFGATRISHGHKDPFHITFHGKGGLLEPDWFVQWDYDNAGRGGRSSMNWSKHPVGHNTLLVDRKAMDALTQPLTVAGHNFGSAAKVIRVSGSVYPGVEQSRTLALTRGYLLDLFEARSDVEHTYDWILHGLGDLDVPGFAFSPFDIGADLGFNLIDSSAPNNAENRWMRNGLRAAAPETWSAIWKQAKGDAWRQDKAIGVRVSVLGDPGTTIHRADGPYYVSSGGLADRPEDGKTRAVPLVVARRQGRNTVYLALHEPFDDTTSSALRLRRIRANDGILAVEIRAESYTDYFFHAGGASGPRQVQSEIGSFRLNGSFGFIRREGKGTVTQGLSESALDFRSQP